MKNKKNRIRNNIIISIKIFFIVIICFYSKAGIVYAQDMQLTQFYASPIYLNPAFTGSTGCTRVSMNSRRQWLSIPGAYSSSILSIDHYSHSINSGIGFLMLIDKHGAGNIRTNSYNMSYAYQTYLNHRWSVRFGLQAGYNTMRLDFNDFTFADQIITGSSTTVETQPLSNTGYADFSSGLLLFSKKTWIGFSAHHLNRPINSLIEEDGRLPIKYSLHSGIVIPLGTGTEDLKYNFQSLSPAFQFKKQGRYDQFDLGLYYNYHSLVLGCWYRGIPVLKTYEKKYSNNDAIAFILGFSSDKLNVGYSYDMTISKLSAASGGAHEISFFYKYCNPKKKKRRVASCPKF